MKNLFLFTFLLTSYFVSFAQTKIVIDRKDGTKDSIAVNAISQFTFSSSDIYQPSLLEVQQILDTTAVKFLQYAETTNGDPWRALMLTANWVQSQPNVQSVFTIDSTYLDIVLKSGLQTDFFFNSVDNNGYSIFRGGGGQHPEQANISFSKLSKNTITNKKVLIYAPAWTEFNLQSTVPKTVTTLTNSGLGLDVTVLKDEECTPAIANTFKDYGLIILDTHGLPDAYMSGTIINVDKKLTTELQYKDAVIQQVGQDFYNSLLNNDFKKVSYTNIPTDIPNWQKRKDLKQIEKIFVTTKYIKTLASMPNSVIFGNMCFSGYSVANPKRNFTYPIKTAFMDKNPISYYCYALNNGRSTAVEDNFAKAMEDSITKRLVKDLDSTGVAHLRPADGKEYFDPYIDKAYHLTLLLKHFGSDDYSYQKCGDTLIDTRDGQKYATVCIGKQNWMAQNLNFNAPSSFTYDNNPANGVIYGRLYDYKTIMQGADSSKTNPSGVRGICPKGWHVPSFAEFETLFETLGDAVGYDIIGGAMKAKVLWKAPNTGATNSSGFTGLPGGSTIMIDDPEGFLNLGIFADFATTTSEDGFWVIWNLVYDSPDIQLTQGLFKNWGVSCRCVKD